MNPEPEYGDGFNEWFDDMRQRAWDDVKSHYHGEPMYPQYLLLIKPYFWEAYKAGMITLMRART